MIIIIIIIIIINNIIKYIIIYKWSYKSWIILRIKFRLKYVTYIILNEQKKLFYMNPWIQKEVWLRITWDDSMAKSM
jgi:hypothetical protein